jgi:hypothetical protein
MKRVTITKDDKGKLLTYDCVQVLEIISVKDGDVRVKDDEHGRILPDLLSVARLEELFACGRAEWGDCVDDDDDSVVKAKW